MKTTIVGLGALGSHLVLIARNWSTRFDVIDFDRVETKNIQSQFHTKMGNGKTKVMALKAAMHGLFNRPLSVHPVKVTKDNAREVLYGSDLVIDCTDNYMARKLIQNDCMEHHVPCLHGCLSADGNFARIVWTEHFVPDSEGAEGGATCEDGRNLPFHIQAAAMISQVAQRWMDTGKKESYQVSPFSVVRLT